MYKIIGSDQKEYGPISLDQIRQWANEGRVNGNTMVQPEGETDWRPLSSVPELAAFLPAPSAPTPGAPIMGAAPATSAALQQVQGPAIGLIIVAILGFLVGLLGLVSNVLGAGAVRHTGNPNIDKWMEMSSGGLGIVLNIIGMGVSALILVGALKMKKLENYSLVMAATIVGMIPFLSPCCCVGLPIGIWVLVVLNRPEVKSAFH